MLHGPPIPIGAGQDRRQPPPHRRTKSASQRRNNNTADKSLQTKPSLYPAGQVPGSHGVFEDFGAVHINQTVFIHLTVRPYSFSVTVAISFSACPRRIRIPTTDQTNVSAGNLPHVAPLVHLDL